MPHSKLRTAWRAIIYPRGGNVATRPVSASVDCLSLEGSTPGWYARSVKVWMEIHRLRLLTQSLPSISSPFSINLSGKQLRAIPEELWTLLNSGPDVNLDFNSKQQEVWCAYGSSVVYIVCGNPSR